MKIRIHDLMECSAANGPGERCVLWLQGCPLHCPGCFNPETHDPNGGTETDTAALAARIIAAGRDLSVSGGEPFFQAEALRDLLERLPRERSVLVFSGYPIAELRADPARAACLPFIDVLICGPYRAELPPDYSRFCSSANQELILLTKKYCSDDFRNLPLSEVQIAPDGTVRFSGIAR